MTQRLNKSTNQHCFRQDLQNLQVWFLTALPSCPVIARACSACGQAMTQRFNKSMTQRLNKSTNQQINKINRLPGDSVRLQRLRAGNDSTPQQINKSTLF
jgi:hypothetical protein